MQQDTGNLPVVSVQQIEVEQSQNTFIQPKLENVDMADLEEALLDNSAVEDNQSNAQQPEVLRESQTSTEKQDDLMQSEEVEQQQSAQESVPKMFILSKK